MHSKVTVFFFFFFHAGEFHGANRFLAFGSRLALNHAEAGAVCQQNNALLPRRLPTQTVSFLNGKFMTLSKGHGHYLNFWLNECTSTGDCYAWHIDSYTDSQSKITTLASGSKNGSSYVVCESGESITLITVTVFLKYIMVFSAFYHARAHTSTNIVRGRQKVCIQFLQNLILCKLIRPA